MEDNKRAQLLEELEKQEQAIDIKCQNEMNQVLAKYGRSLEPRVTIVMNGPPIFEVGIRRIKQKAAPVMRSIPRPEPQPSKEEAAEVEAAAQPQS